MPAAVPGIAFLSGGLSEELATQYLSAINALDSLDAEQQNRRAPWALTFSYGRALQQSCLRTWAGLAENVAAAQQVLLARAKANAEASLGKYVAGSMQPSVNESLFVSEYKY